MTLIAHVFPKLQTPKNVVRLKSKKSSLEGPLDWHHSNRAETLNQSQWHNLYCIHWPLSRWLSLKESLLVTCKFLRFFVNTLTTDHKYSLLSRDNSMQTIQMLLSQKQKNFLTLFVLLSNVHKILNIFKKRWPP